MVRITQGQSATVSQNVPNTLTIRNVAQTKDGSCHITGEGIDINLQIPANSSSKPAQIKGNPVTVTNLGKADLEFPGGVIATNKELKVMIPTITKEKKMNEFQVKQISNVKITYAGETFEITQSNDYIIGANGNLNVREIAPIDNKALGDGFNNNLFSQTYDQLIKEIVGTGNPYFQMLSSPKSFAWAVATTGQMDPQAYQIMSGMPLWSPIGDFAFADAQFFKAYQQVLPHLKLTVASEKDQQIKEAKDHQVAAQNAITKAESDRNQQYLAAMQNGGAIFTNTYPTIKDWLGSSVGQAYQDAVDKASAQLVQANQSVATLMALANSKFQTLKEAMDLLKMPDNAPASNIAPRGWTKVPGGDGILRWQPEWKIETTGPDWRAELTNGTIGEKNITLSSSNSSSTLNKSWAGGSADYGTFFWGINASGDWSKIDLTESDKNVSVTIKMKSLTTVEVTPGDWYDGGILKEAAKGQEVGIDTPWVAKGSQESKSLFGQYGILSTRVAALVVAYKPSYTITMSSSTYEKHFEKINASAGLRIGPFNFGGQGGHEVNVTHNASGETTFTDESTSDDPVIIGILVAFPGVDAP